MSDLAFNRVLKVTLGLSSFWSFLHAASLIDGIWWNSDLERLVDVLLRSKDTTQELQLKIDEETTKDSYGLLPLFLYKLKWFKKLRIVKGQTPLAFRLKGESVEGIKSFEMESLHEEIHPGSILPGAAVAMRRARKFLGTV